MQSILLLIQYASQNIALFCCALFAGAATYISLVEQPAINESGRRLTEGYLVFVQPRPVFFQTFFSVVGALAGIMAGIAGNAIGWLAGGLVLGFAACLQLLVVKPEVRRLIDLARSEDPGEKKSASLDKLARLYAIQSLAGLAALFMFIIKV